MLFVGAQPHLRGVRGQQPLRAAGPRPGAGGRPLRAAGIEPASRRRRQPPAVRCRPQPLHPVHPLRAGLRRDRGRAHLGRDGPRRRRAGRSPTWHARGASRRPAPAAASACRSAPPAPCSRRAAPWPRAARQRARSCPTCAVLGREATPMTRPRLATVWLDGCSGCHMSFLDMDERLLEIAERADLVYSPLDRRQGVPRAASTSAWSRARSPARTDLRKIRRSGSGPGRWSRSATARSPRTSPACATRSAPQPLLQRAYLENVTLNARVPRRSSRAAADGAAGARVVDGRRVPARLPAVGRPDLPALVDLLAGRPPDIAPGAGSAGEEMP